MKRQRLGTDTIEFHILPKHQTGKEHKHQERRQVKNSTSGKPRGHLIPNRRPPAHPQHSKQKLRRQKENGRTMTIRITHNRGTALERSIIHHLGREELKQFYTLAILALGSVVVYEHISYLVRVEDFYRINASLSLRPGTPTCYYKGR